MNSRPAAGWEEYTELAGNPLLWLVLLLTGCLIYTLTGRSTSAGAAFSPAALASPAPGAGPSVQPLPAPGLIAPEPAPELSPPPAATAADSEPGRSLAAQALVLFLFAGIYALACQPWANYTLVFTLGAFASVYAGAQFGFYPPAAAWRALAGNLDILCFLAGMNLLTSALALTGIFEHLGGRTAALAGSDPWRLMLGFCLATYAVSLLVNNLTTMMLLVPIILNVSRRLELEPRPYLIGMIVASNLGGASTMIGDFPNILIGSRAGVGFDQFLAHMLPVCLLLLGVLLVYLRLTQDRLWTPPQKKARGAARPAYDNLFARAARPAAGYGSPFSGRREPAPETLARPLAALRGLAILAAVLAAFFICSPAVVPPALIASAGGLAALFLTGLDKRLVLKGLAYRDILFFAGLFVLTGAAQASGLLDWFGSCIVRLSFGSVPLRCLLLMWAAAAAAAFLNAGPCTALFLPLVSGFKTAAPQDLYWWSLSLGVLAGSSATLTGATAGSVTATMLSSHQASMNLAGPRLTFRAYAREAAPLALIFLAVSSGYIIWLYKAG